ncbi:MAG: transposase [Candidatus Omnitrophica bacterium]|nr:transposase [Candidatus Omnitrophota bacterium]
MPRPLRIHMEGVLYYVTCQAGAHGFLFKDEADFRTFQELLDGYRGQYDFKLYGYLLLPDQIHLVLEVARGTTVSDLMHALNSRYTKLFRKRHDFTGHLFKGRYKASVVEKKSSLSALVDYIHALPVRKGLAERPSSYRFSSLPSYLEEGKGILSHLDLSAEAGELLYHMQSAHSGMTYEDYLVSIPEQEWLRREKLLSRPVVGPAAFVDSVREQAQDLPSPEAAKASTPGGPVVALTALEKDLDKRFSLTMASVALVLTAWISLNTAGLVNVGPGVGLPAPQPAQKTASVGGGEPRISKGPAIARQEIAVSSNPEVRSASFVSSPELAGTRWEIQMKPMYASGNPELEMDTLRFDGRTMVSSHLSGRGFEGSNYTSVLHADGTLRWETMQEGPKEEVVFWRGELRGGEMRGICSRHPKEGPPQDFVFIGVQPSDSPRRTL